MTYRSKQWFDKHDLCCKKMGDQDANIFFLFVAIRTKANTQYKKFFLRQYRRGYCYARKWAVIIFCFIIFLYTSGGHDS